MVNELEKAVNPEHYKGTKVETIDILEMFISQEASISPVQKYNLAQALKYIFRAGRKNDALEDLQKAENYLHRALTGEWLDPEFFVRKTNEKAENV